MIELLPDEFEAELAALMQQRAERVRIHEQSVDPLHVDGQLVEPNSVERVRRVRPRLSPLLAVAAAVLVVLGIGGIGRFQNRSGTATTAAQPTGVVAAEYILWLENDTTDTEVEAIVTVLDELSTVTGYTYIDRAQTFAEFTEYFADSPEVLAAVEPEDLPVSFRITSTDDEELRQNLEGLAGFRQLDRSD